MSREILVTQETRRALIADFKIPRNSLFRALKGQSGSSRANLLRAAALERGGVQVGSKIVYRFEDIETEWTCEKKIQTIGDVRIEYSLTSADAWIYKSDVVVETFKNVRIMDVTDIIEKGIEWANK